MKSVPKPYSAYYPKQVLIDSYGNGGFRFANMSHRGSLLLLPSGVYNWAPHVPLFLQEDFELILADYETIQILVIGIGGIGKSQAVVDDRIIGLLRDKRIALEIMDTGAAVRCYNLLFDENRAVAAALMAI